tara:strand:+ start:825 stop:1571 length:747 start_codon:yes stop_codon:yes gene_type:complete
MAVKCDKIILNPTNARTVKVTGGTRSIKVHKYKNKIVSLELPDDKVIALEQTISIKNKSYKVNIIKQNFVSDIVLYELLVAERTKSTLFALPMLGGERKLYFYDNLLINCFIGVPDHEGCIALLYRWSGDPLFHKFEAAVKEFSNYIDSYVPDENMEFIMFLFDVPKRHTTNYKKFINGEYSKLTARYKEDILKFHGLDITSQLGQIIFKSEKRKLMLENTLNMKLDDDAELYSIIDSNEIFNPKYYL